MHALVIEKDQAIGEIICEILSELGFTCKVMDKYEEAFCYLKTFSPDLVILDVKVDERYQTLIGLLNDSHTVSILTSTNDKDQNKLVNHFLSKPFSMKELERIALNVKNNIDKLNNFQYSERKLNNLKERRM